ncbi:zinc-ribbon domain-containing protein [Herbiconiux solani]|uniref:zinc-ribbon domain-containing protein n=1 Tax=Herbiconiux solani TaxID=661329 RepID=UPI000A01F0D8|nr:zinc-ribbon domain-containing protein [Herbiconiux solani]
MAENIGAWWERRQRSKGREVPYAVGTFREEWASFPMLIRQYHPDFNRGITLTQIPPAAEVYLVWQCDTGHIFVATPEEQRARPAGRRRRSVWCPVCRDLANPPRIRPAPLSPVPAEARVPAETRDPDESPRSTEARRPASTPTALQLPGPVDGMALDSGPMGAQRIRRPESTPSAPRRPARGRSASSRSSAAGEGGRAVGTAFWSAVAPKPASAAEALLRHKLGERLEVDLRPNAVAVGRPFHDRREVWPDFVIDELRVAVEYDTVGRFGLEHVGPREDSDRAKDRLLREAGWEVVRIRCRPLRPLGRWDLEAPGSGVNDKLVERLIERLGEIRGDLLVAAYRRPPGQSQESVPAGRGGGASEAF